MVTTRGFGPRVLGSSPSRTSIGQIVEWLAPRSDTAEIRVRAPVCPLGQAHVSLIIAVWNRRSNEVVATTGE